MLRTVIEYDMRFFYLRVSLLPILLAFTRYSFAMVDPAHRLEGLTITGIDLPTKTVEIPAAQVSAYGDNAVEHCYVFPSFAAFEVDTGQVGAESIAIRRRAEGESAEDLCKLPLRKEDHVLDHVDGYVLGARGPYAVVTAADSFGSQGGFTVYQTPSGKKLLYTERNNDKPLTFQLTDGILALHFFVALTLDCDVSAGSCWTNTLQKNHVPADVVLVRPSCSKQALQTKPLVSVPVHVDDVAHAKIIFENGQPTCDPSP